MFLGIDLGTGSVKAVVIGKSGEVFRSTRREYRNDAPEPGFEEVDPNVWWSATVAAVSECVEGVGSKIEGIGLSGQAHGFVLLDEGDNPLRKAILWPDTRTAEILNEIESSSDVARQGLKNPLATGMAGPGLLWVKRHEPALFDRAKVFLSPKDWIKFKLTGIKCTEPTDASMTLLYDFDTRDWSEEFLTFLDLPAKILPSIRPSTAVAGQLLPSAADLLNLPLGVPVSGGLSDTAACLFGMGITEPGSTVLQIGSGIQIMSVLGPESATEDLRFNTYEAAEERRYLMAAMLNGGTVFEWVMDLIDADWKEMYEAGFGDKADSAGIVFLPYAGGERSPLMDPKATAAFLNLKLGHSRHQMIRSIFEGVAHAILDSWEEMKLASGVISKNVLVTGGGAQDGRWLQMLSDKLGVNMTSVSASQDATMGAAYLGGIASGHWNKLDEVPIPKISKISHRPNRACRSMQNLERHRNLYRKLKN